MKIDTTARVMERMRQSTSDAGGALSAELEEEVRLDALENERYWNENGWSGYFATDPAE